MFETTPRATELFHDDLLSDATLKGDGTSIHLLSTRTADTLGTACGKFRRAGASGGRDARPTRGRGCHGYPLAELSSATFVEAGKSLGRLNRDYLILPPSWLQDLLSDLDFGMRGEFFVDGPSATAPVQGGLGDCWLIAAMASVAWTHPELVSERTRRRTSPAMSMPATPICTSSSPTN